MNNLRQKRILSIVFILFMSIFYFMENTEAQNKDRSKLDKKYIWKLEDIYPTDAEWKKAFDNVKTDADALVGYKGKLGSSANILLEFLTKTFNLNKELDRIYSYAHMKSDQDTREAQYLSLLQELRQYFSVVGSKLAFTEPEILEIGQDKIDQFMTDQPGLGVFKMYLHNLYRNKSHRLSEPEEKILAGASVLLSAPSSIRNVLSNAEFPYPTVTLSDGTKAKLDNAGYDRYRASTNRADREFVFKEFWAAMGKFQKTYAEQLFAQVNADIFLAKTRKYNSSLEAALAKYNIPVEVYHALISNVNKNLGTFHRYLKLKKRMMGLDVLKYSDLYAPAVKDVNLTFSFEEAHTMMVESMKPLGKTYQDLLELAKKDRWIDVYPTEGKRSGAYSNGSVYDVHPYVLLNYNEKYNDVGTYTHEMGHALHSYFSNTTQPYPTADYSIFVAEVASTFNEALLDNYFVNKIKDGATRLSVLMEQLDGFKGTLFRQTQFAEFELAIHEKAEAGEALSNEALNKMYGDIIRKYYGSDQGVCEVDKAYHVEWMFIPHFYYNFYVYQYATSFTASNALAEKVLSGEPGIVDKYIRFLSSGSTDYPIQLLKNAGVDMTTNEPFDKAISAMNKIMDEMEAILNKK